MTGSCGSERERLILKGERAEDLEYENLKILQKGNGYRFTSDSVLLAGLAEVKPTDKVVDLGTGSGVIATLISARTDAEVWGVEIQETLADRARRSVLFNGIEEKVHIVRCDMREAHKILKAGWFDVAVSNPPYYLPNNGAPRSADFDSARTLKRTNAEKVGDWNPSEVGGRTENPNEVDKCANPSEVVGHTANPSEVGGRTENPSEVGGRENLSEFGKRQNPSEGGERENPNEVGGELENPNEFGKRQNPNASSGAERLRGTASAADCRDYGERELARFEILVTLKEVFRSARRLLKHGGKLFVVSKAERLTDILTELRAEGLEPKTLIPIQPNPAAAVDTVVVKAVKGGKPPLKFLAPFVVLDESGKMTEQTRRIYHK